MKGQIRCAIYTRKSSEEGLEQSFNSLDAQREACEAYIKSQTHEGWTALPAKYDDGGFSGGNIQRPALVRLMADIAEGKVNTVVVYKVDRLTRSLADFAKIIEQFDSKGVTFVSVTQQFNTTTSMGRLTLNVLLSFAQFEREVTGERIRDKILASKQKGMFMGGRVPLGYDLRDRRLWINEEEASSVREIYCQYLRLGTVPALKAHLATTNIRSKPQLEHGKSVGRNLFGVGPLHRILTNRLYVGEIAHRGRIYTGEHEALIERGVWERVQKRLAANRQGNRTGRRSSKGSFLTGLIFDEQGNRFTPTHAKNNGKRYRYYTSEALIKHTKENVAVGRIPASELESAVVERIFEFLRSPLEVLKVASRLAARQGNHHLILRRATQKVEEWGALSASDREAALKRLLHRIVVRGDSIDVEVDKLLLLEAAFGKPVDANQLEPDEAQVLSLKCPFRHKHVGKALRLVLGENTSFSPISSNAILKAIARARLWYEQIVTGEVGSIPDLARRHGVAPRYVTRILPCALLSPQIIEGLLQEQASATVTLDQVVRCAAHLRWEEQRIA